MNLGVRLNTISTGPTGMFFLLFSVFFINFAYSSGAPINCPSDCHCLTDSKSSTQLKVNCNWSSFDARKLNRLETKKVSHLTITCALNSLPLQWPGQSEIFSEFRNLKQLKLQNCLSQLQSVPSGFFSGLVGLRSLRIENENPSGPLRIDSGAFRDLRTLENFHLSHHSYLEIPSGEFCGLSELKLLNLSHNHISAINSVGLQDCPKEVGVIILDLSHNRIKKLESPQLAVFRHLHILHLTDNLVNAVTSGAFEGLHNLQELRLGHNRISQFYEDINSALPNVKYVDLSHNFLSAIPAGIVSSNTLERLNLSHNSLDSKLVPVVFKAQKLEQLDLSHNHIQQIDDFLLSNLTSLRELHLENNSIESIQLNSFQLAKKLAYMDFSHNRLAHLNKEVFAGLGDLVTLKVDHNLISSISYDFFTEIPKLTHFSAASNQLTEVPGALTALYFLADLDLSGNQIRSARKFLFDKLPNLKRLNLAHNRLTTVDRYEFENIPKLLSLQLGHNDIKSITAGSFDRNAQLQELRLENNSIADLQGIFGNLPSLQAIHISSNQLTYVDLSLLPANLTTLIASHNRIRKLSSSLSRWANLEVLDLAYNKLTELSGELLPTSIQKLNVSHNGLLALAEKTFHAKGNLSWVDLRHNRLESLNQSSLTLKEGGNRTAPFHLYLLGNPLKCLCTLDWLKVYDSSAALLSPSTPLVIDYTDLSCTSLSGGHQSQLLREMVKSDFLCSYDVICSDMCPCCDFDICDCNNVCPDGCDCFYDSTLSVNIVQCSGAVRKPIAPINIPMFATEIHLDGNFAPHLKSNAFLGRYRLKKLFLNNSAIERIEPKAFNGLTSLEILDLSDNRLTKLSGEEFFNLPKLNRLALNGNRLSQLEPNLLANMPNLRELALHHNQLQLLPASLELPTNNLSTVTLAGNPWKCDCNDRFRLQTWLPAHFSLVPDHKFLFCSENFTETKSNGSTILSRLPPGPDNTVKVNFITFMTEINATFCHGSTSAEKRFFDIHTVTIGPSNPEETKAEGLSDVIIAVVASLAAFFLASMVIGLLVAFCCRRHKLHSRYQPHQSHSESQGAPSPHTPLINYDAFLTYSAADCQFIHEKLLPQLELEFPYYQLCLLYRDLPTPAYNSFHLIEDSLIRALQQSKRVVIVITEQFLKKEWETLQIRTALKMVLDEKQHKRLIFLLVGNVQLDLIDPTLGYYLRTSVCISWGDPMFWEKLRDSMPDKILDSPLNRTVSSEIYGTIVPSDFV